MVVCGKVHVFINGGSQYDVRSIQSLPGGIFLIISNLKVANMEGMCNLIEGMSYSNLKVENVS